MDVATATVTPAGGFFNDRRFAFVDAGGACVNGKRDATIHTAGTAFDTALSAVTITDRRTGSARRFALDDAAGIAQWVSAIVGRTVTLERRDDGGFPDDGDAPGPTIVSSATIAAVAGWFPGVTPDAMRRRLRANIEIGGVPAFWEDRLFGAAGTVVAIRVGEVALEGTNPCQRCVVPSRDPDTAAAIPGFSKTFTRRRAAELPAWAERDRFDHFYRVAVNTRTPAGEAGRAIALGDPVLV